MPVDYLYTTQRLGMRAWRPEDVEPFAAMNSDPKVMQHFPRLLSREETRQAIVRFNAHYEAHGFTYFATEELSSGEFVGFIGLKLQTFEHPHAPILDVGWRLKVDAWGKGYATEGATGMLDMAFGKLRLSQVHAVAPALNHRSIRVMQKIGMRLCDEFEHPDLSVTSPLRHCHLYKIEASEHLRHRSTTSSPDASHDEKKQSPED